MRRALLGPPDDRLLIRSLINFAVSLTGSLLLVGVAFGVRRLLGFTQPWQEPIDLTPSVWNVLLVVVFTPVFETLMLAVLLAVLVRLRQSIVVTAAISGVLWGVLHGLSSPMWFFGPAFAFFIFSCAYLVWRPRSFWHACAAAAVPHVLQNMTAMLMLALAG